jgi:hypothetical protein
MSHIPTIVAQIARAAHEAAETFGTSPGTYAMSLFSPPSTDRIPLSLRTSHELWARSAELARMAETARTTDAKVALETLACPIRGTRSEARGCRGTGAQESGGQ